MKQHEEETKTSTKSTPKPTTGKAGGIPSTKPADKVKPAPGDSSVKSDKTPTAATNNKKPPKVEDTKKEEDK